MARSSLIAFAALTLVCADRAHADPLQITPPVAQSKPLDFVAQLFGGPPQPQTLPPAQTQPQPQPEAPLGAPRTGRDRRADQPAAAGSRARRRASAFATPHCFDGCGAHAAPATRIPAGCRRSPEGDSADRCVSRIARYRQ